MSLPNAEKGLEFLLKPDFSKVNGEVYDLGRPISEDAEVVLYKWEDEQGKHAFWQTNSEEQIRDKANAVIQDFNGFSFEKMKNMMR